MSVQACATFQPVERYTENFQQPLSRAQIDQLCRAAFGRFVSPVRYFLLTAGKFNTTYRLVFGDGRTVILRVAPPPHATIFRHEAYLMRREAAVQSLLNRVSDKVPENLFVDFSRRYIDRDYVFQRFIPGQLWDELDPILDDESRRDLWRQLASAVKPIHQVSGSFFGTPDASYKSDSWAKMQLDILEGMLEDMHCYGLDCQDAAEFLRLCRRGAAVLDEIKQPKLVHGDLWKKNLLIEKNRGQWQLAGILDAERAFWGEPGAEWIFSFQEIPDDFWSVYGELPQGEGADFRRLVYLGKGAIQLCLEGWRFRFDSGFARQILQNTMNRMRLHRCLQSCR